MLNYLQMSELDREVTIDVMGQFPAVVKIRVDGNGELWVHVVSATQDAPILLDEVVTVPPSDEEE